MPPEGPRPLHHLDLSDPAHRGFAATFLAEPFDEAFARWYVHLTRSVAFLRAFARKDAIRLLYLDSLDLDADDPLPSQRHHLREVEAVHDALAPGAIIAVDDHFVHRGAPGGKGSLVERFLRERRVPLVHDGYLEAWQLGDAARGP